MIPNETRQDVEGNDIKIHLDKSLWQSCKHDNYAEALNPKDETVYVCLDCGYITKNVCEKYSRVCGYLRPVSGWNKGKQQEFMNREVFSGITKAEKKG